MERATWLAIAAFTIGGAGLAWAFWPAPATPSGVFLAEDVSDDVTAKATLVRGPETLLFNLSLDTHTVDITAFDASRQVRLRTSAEELAPTRIRVVTPGSHHVSVEVEFPRIDGPVSLSILEVGAEPERRLGFP